MSEVSLGVCQVRKSASHGTVICVITSRITDLGSFLHVKDSSLIYSVTVSHFIIFEKVIKSDVVYRLIIVLVRI